MKFGSSDVFSDANYWRSILGGLVSAALTVAFPIIAMTRGALHNIHVLSWNERILINLAIVFGAIIAGAAYKTFAHFPSAIKEKKTRPTNLNEALVRLKATIAGNGAFLLLQSTVLLNTAAAVLCKRISITELGQTAEAQLIISTAGLVIFAAGGLLLGLSIIYRPLKATEKVVEATHTHAPGGNGAGNGSGNGKGSLSGNGKNDQQQSSEEAGKKSEVKALPLVQYPELSAWLVIIAGIALVENAWMPLLSLPGLLVAMKWYLAGKAANLQFAGDGEELDVSKARWKIVPFIY